LEIKTKKQLLIQIVSAISIETHQFSPVKSQVIVFYYGKKNNFNCECSLSCIHAMASTCRFKLPTSCLL